jgi:putative adhesin
MSREEITMEQWRIEEPQTLDLEGVRRLNIRVVAGTVDVVGRPGDTGAGAANIEVSKIEGPLQVSLDGGTLTITHERLTWGGLLDWVGGRRASAVVSVAVPEGCPVELGVVSADAVVSGIAAPTKVKSVSGDVTLDGVRSDVTAQTVSGDLESRGLAGQLQFQTVSGDLTVVDGSSGRVKAETVSGQVTLDLDVPPNSSIELASVSGDLTLRLPETAGLQVEVKTMSGDLDSAFGDVTTERKPGRATLRGQVGHGSGKLHAKTVSGDVTLLSRESV